jgi:acyl dehydratase
MNPRIGEKLPSSEIRISQAMIDAYAALSGDFNPIHVDPAVAAASMFGGTVAHGCIPLEPIFQSIARWSGRGELPRDAVLRLRYRAPSRPGDVIRSEAETVSSEPQDGGQKFVIAFALLNQRNERVIDGECVVVL